MTRGLVMSGMADKGAKTLSRTQIEQRLVYPDTEAEEPPKSDGEIKFREVGFFFMPPRRILNQKRRTRRAG